MILKISRQNPLDSLPPLTAPHGRQHVENYIKKNRNNTGYMRKENQAES